MDQLEHLDIVVTADEAKAIRDRIASGDYASTSDLLRAALKALERDETERSERLDAVRRKLQASLDDTRPDVPAEEVFDYLKKYLDKRQAQLDGKA